MVQMTWCRCLGAAVVVVSLSSGLESGLYSLAVTPGAPPLAGHSTVTRGALTRPALPAGLVPVLRRMLGRAAVRWQGSAEPMTGTQWSQQAEFTGTSSGQFGSAVALSGDTALVGAPLMNNHTGVAYVFVRSGTTWTQQAQLVANDGTSGSELGSAVALSGNTALVGAPLKNGAAGAAYVFVRSGTTWTQQIKLSDPSPSSAFDQFGWSVALSGNTAVVGAPYKNGTGGAYVYVRSGATWTMQAALTASDAVSGDSFGWSVSVNRNTALVGSWGKNSSTGAVYVFVSSGATWTKQAELTALDGVSNDRFGWSVAAGRMTVLIGAPYKNGDGTVYVFVRSGTTWTQQDELTEKTGASNDQFGQSVALSGATALVGAPYKNKNGATYVFVRNGTSWTPQAELTAKDGATADEFGWSVSLSSNTALVGAPLKNSFTGAAYVFVRT